jgi:murein DD-endopeptidase MepM/ murein hydrolase activator NlpD
MKKMKNHFKIGILLIGISVVLITCKKEKSTTQQSNLETLSTEEVISYFEMQKTSSKANSDNKKQVTPNLKGITQEKIINSSALLTIIPATTIYPEHYSRILMLKINQEIRAVVFSMYSSKESKGENFSGEIMITDLDGNFINGYRVSEGKLKTQFRGKTNKNESSFNYISSAKKCEDHGNCYSGNPCTLCIQQLDEVVVVEPASNYIYYYNLFFGFNNFNPTQGGDQSVDENWSFGGGGGSPRDLSNPVQDSKPCPGNPVKNPEIAPQTNSGIQGGLHNTCARKQKDKICDGKVGYKLHDGVDIKNDYGEPIFAMYDGEAEYGIDPKGAGHYVGITSTINGNTVRLVFFHLQEAGIKTGPVKAGDIIGYQGVSGNLKRAIDNKHVDSHVHVKAQKNGNMADPLPYFATTIDPKTGIIIKPCK